MSSSTDRMGLELQAAPPQLRELLLEFTLNVLLHQPTDLLDFAIEYFNKLKEKRDHERAVNGTGR